MENIYIKYFKYVYIHKKNVFKECIQMSKQYKGKDKWNLIIHAFTHDLSKFNPIEFIPYAKWFYGNGGKCLEKDYNCEQLTNNMSCLSKYYLGYKQNFNKAWIHHYENNKHHWNYWTVKKMRMPPKYIRHMICDWSAMGKQFGNSAQEYYLQNYSKIAIDRDSRLLLEAHLGLCYDRFSECDEYYWKTIKEIVDSVIEYRSNNPNNFNDKWFKEFVDGYKNKYNIDILDL